MLKYDMMSVMQGSEAFYFMTSRQGQRQRCFQSVNVMGEVSGHRHSASGTGKGEGSDTFRQGRGKNKGSDTKSTSGKARARAATLNVSKDEG
jgi:hypothetical protein